METQRDIHQRATDDMIEAGLEQQGNIQFKRSVKIKTDNLKVKVKTELILRQG